MAITEKVRRVLFGAIAVCLALAFGLYALFIPEPVRVPQLQIPVLPDDQVTAAELAHELEEVLAKPLFWAERRPVDDSETPLEQASSVDGIRLLGIFVTPDYHAALLSDGTHTERVFRGGSFAGWRLDEVTADGVVLMSSDDRVTLPVVSLPSAAIRLQP